MSQEFVALFQKRFPPMYKEAEGLKYTVAVFLSRLKVLAIVSIAFISLAFVTWFVVPVSLSSPGDWTRLASRAVLAGIGGWIIWKALYFLRKLDRDLANTLASRQRIGEDEEIRTLAELAATMMAVSYSVSPTSPKSSLPQPKLADFSMTAMLRVAYEIDSRLARQTVGQHARPELARESLSTACKIHNLITASGYRLVAPGHVETKAIGSISQSVSKAIQDAMKSQRAGLFSLSDLSSIIASNDAEALVIEKQPEAAARELIAWLESIHVGIESQPPTEIPIMVTVKAKTMGS